jgi:hypothetical protein
MELAVSLDVNKLCSVCAWRAGCQKKYTIGETALHCPDFCRDVSLGHGDAEPPRMERHKQVEDVFGGKK